MKFNMMYTYPCVMLHLLFIKYPCEQNVTAISNI